MIPRTPAQFDSETLKRNAVEICQRRGYHSPLLNQHVYADPDLIPGPGSGDCFWCGSTVYGPTQEAERARLAAADCANIIGKAA